MNKITPLCDSGFFRVAEVQGRHWFTTPTREPFFSIGLNHIDSTTLRYQDNLPLWKNKYGGDACRWIREAVVPDLTQWGFNTIGWTQEVVIRTPEICRHSASWTATELRAADMPYCHLLPFAEVHHWDVETRYPNVMSEAFAQWCDYVARRDCADMADDPNLIGYFYSDCPNWVHPSANPELKGAWFDPDCLRSEAGRREFSAAVERYYQVTRDAIRRYDPNHLLLGDRLEGRAPLPDEVVRIAARYVDVLSFQYFASVPQMLPDLARWHEMSGKPILLADAAVPGRRELSFEEQGQVYGEMMEALFAAPFVIGWHYCGAYLENHVRGAGLRDRHEQPRNGLTDAMARANHSVRKRVPPR